MSLRAWTPTSRFPVRIRTSIQNMKQVVKNLSARKIWSQKSFYFLQVSPFIHFISLSYALTINSYDSSYAFPFTHDVRTGKAIILVYERQDRYWYNKSRTRTSCRGYPRSQSPLRHQSPDVHPPRTTRQESQPSPPQRPPLGEHEPV